VKRVASPAGRSAVAFTLERYGHLYLGAEDDLMGALDALRRAAEMPDNVVRIRKAGACCRPRPRSRVAFSWPGSHRPTKEPASAGYGNPV